MSVSKIYRFKKAKSKLFAFFILLLFLFNSNISVVAQETTKINFTPFTIGCANPPNGNYVIRSKEEFISKIETLDSKASCTKYDLLKVDFSVYTLLIIYMEGKMVRKEITQYGDSILVNISYSPHKLANKIRWVTKDWSIIPALKDNEKVYFEKNMVVDD